MPFQQSIDSTSNNSSLIEIILLWLGERGSIFEAVFIRGFNKA